MNELWCLRFDGMSCAAPSKTAAEVAALKTGGEVKVWTGTISAHMSDVGFWNDRIDAILKNNSKALSFQINQIETKLGLAKSILYAIAKTYDDDELRSKALDAYNDL